MQQIPVTTDAYQTFKTILDNQLVTIDLQWQDGSSSWFISVYNSSKVFISHKRLNTNTFILAQFPLRGVKGGIIAISNTTPNAKLSRDSFQNNFKLIYASEKDLDELRTL
jgi:hypothetical protein